MSQGGLGGGMGGGGMGGMGMGGEIGQRNRPPVMGNSGMNRMGSSSGNPGGRIPQQDNSADDMNLKRKIAMLEAENK